MKLAAAFDVTMTKIPLMYGKYINMKNVKKYYFLVFDDDDVRVIGDACEGWEERLGAGLRAGESVQPWWRGPCVRRDT